MPRTAVPRRDPALDPALRAERPPAISPSSARRQPGETPPAPTGPPRRLFAAPASEPRRPDDLPERGSGRRPPVFASRVRSPARGDPVGPPNPAESGGIPAILRGTTSRRGTAGPAHGPGKTGSRRVPPTRCLRPISGRSRAGLDPAREPPPGRLSPGGEDGGGGGNRTRVRKPSTATSTCLSGSWRRTAPESASASSPPRRIDPASRGVNAIPEFHRRFGKSVG